MTEIDEVQVSLGSRSYPIVVGSGILDCLPGRIIEITRPTSVVILSHPSIAKLYAPPILTGFEREGIRTTLVTVPPGERFKNLRTVARLYDRMLVAGLDRRGLMVTLGGGVLGDIGGFAAATYLRGIAYIQVPTTLLAQVDASVGGKTGVDLPSGKNLVGAFYQPRAVFIDTDTLRSLPLRELRSGLAEILKYGIIRDNDFFDRSVADLPRLLHRDGDALSTAIIQSCRIKASVVSEDETEQGTRAILNFGHTVGHALEALTGYRRFKHGEAISIGMVAAALIGQRLGLAGNPVIDAIRNALARAGLPTIYPSDVGAASVIDMIRRDKKTIANRLTFILCSRIGHASVVTDVPADVVRMALIDFGACP